MSKYSAEPRDPPVAELDEDREREVEPLAAFAELRREEADGQHAVAVLDDRVERDPAVLDRPHALGQAGPDRLAARCSGSG